MSYITLFEIHTPPVEDSVDRGSQNFKWISHFDTSTCNPCSPCSCRFDQNVVRRMCFINLSTWKSPPSQFSKSFPIPHPSIFSNLPHEHPTPLPIFSNFPQDFILSSPITINVMWCSLTPCTSIWVGTCLQSLKVRPILTPIFCWKRGSIFILEPQILSKICHKFHLFFFQTFELSSKLKNFFLKLIKFGLIRYNQF